MPRESWVEPRSLATENGTAIVNTTTETILFPNIFVPTSFFSSGRAMRVTMYGKLSTSGTPTLKFGVRYGGVGGTLIAESEAITMGSGVTNVNWRLEVQIQTRLNGASGSLLVFGTVFIHTATGTVAANVFGVSGYDAPAEVTLDLTAATELAISATWGTAHASNSITGMTQIVESLGGL